MRIATYNVEWFDALFDDAGALFLDGGWSGRRDVTRAQQAKALRHVFRALDADAALVVEAPDTGRVRRTGPALEHFAAWAGLRARRAVIGFANDTQQEIALLFDPERLGALHDPSEAGDVPRFDDAFDIDLDIDDTPDRVVFSKPPLELKVTAGGQVIRVIGVHVKSKAPHGAKSEADVLRIAIANRRKQLAQCIWLRRRVVAHLNAAEALIVLGDFNDGPGLDEYEQLFGRSGLEIVLGWGEDTAPALVEPHAKQALSGPTAGRFETARFWQPHEQRYLSALLDYIMVSPDLAKREPIWRIWHPFDDGPCFQDHALREALLTASDHFPVTLDISL
ncbi:endonuclease/exonuclease/phosphatase family protein [Actibacterium sp. 188UL27-1]|uniref:endonuclease/exonuclease/phosphatase family protein n=1 Tax=Actibacterium sp. 188UL27-1 TaxID=2786961 RepID=UPI00195AF0BF|nr:endonuclease/exonuclease/phosphatase family protein [Actibacterium sp. 188UL27-1]MBM7069556.1 endonuclease [Actibacterium sp. 188UL27-1]